MADNYKEVVNEQEDEISVVDLKNEDGEVFKFYHIGTIEYKEKWYAFFQPAEEVEGLTDEEVVIFQIVGEDGDEQLAPVEDQNLLDEVFNAFCEELDDEDDCEESCDCGCDDDCDCDDDDEGCHCGCGCHHHHADDDNND